MQILPAWFLEEEQTPPSLTNSVDILYWLKIIDACEFWEAVKRKLCQPGFVGGEEKGVLQV